MMQPDEKPGGEKPGDKFANVKLSRPFVARLKVAAAKLGLPMYVLLEKVVDWESVDHLMDRRTKKFWSEIEAARPARKR